MASTGSRREVVSYDELEYVLADSNGNIGGLSIQLGRRAAA